MRTHRTLTGRCFSALLAFAALAGCATEAQEPTEYELKPAGKADGQESIFIPMNTEVWTPVLLNFRCSEWVSCDVSATIDVVSLDGSSDRTQLARYLASEKRASLPIARAWISRAPADLETLVAEPTVAMNLDGGGVAFSGARYEAHTSDADGGFSLSIGNVLPDASTLPAFYDLEVKVAWR